MIPVARADERQIWVEVYNGAGVRTGIIENIKGGSLTRVLDERGKFSVRISHTDKKASDLLIDGAKVRFYIFEREEKRYLGGGIVNHRGASDKSSDFDLIISGYDELDELEYKSVLQGLEYRDEDIADIISGSGSVLGLLEHLNGWTATVTPSYQYYSRFDGVHILKALQVLVADLGTHFRLGSTPQTIEVGDFGEYNGMTLLQLPAYAPEADENDDVAFIESIQIDEDGKETVDFIVPLGATTGADMALTLEQSTRNSPYAIQSSTWNGRTYYYIGNQTKTLTQIYADNTLRIKFLVYDQIQTLSNTDADIEAASNALYDTAVADFLRKQEPLKQYSVTVSKARQNILPGDKILMQYKGWIQDKQGNLLPPVSINTDFWVMDVTENIGMDGIKTSLKLTNIDRHMMDVSRIIVGELENARVRNLSVKPYSTAYGFVYPRELAPTFDARVPIEINDRILRVRQVTLNVTSTPFRATSQGAAAGGDHDHEIGAVLGGSGGTTTDTILSLYTTAAAFINVGVTYLGGAALPKTLKTSTSSGTHTHPPEFGISDDTQYPGDITIKINGVDRTSALGGDWGTSGAPVNFTVDITEYILAEATLRKVHEIVFGCGSGRGRIEVNVMMYVDVQNVQVN